MRWLPATVPGWWASGDVSGPARRERAGTCAIASSVAEGRWRDAAVCDGSRCERVVRVAMWWLRTAGARVLVPRPALRSEARADCGREYHVSGHRRSAIVGVLPARGVGDVEPRRGMHWRTSQRGRRCIGSPTSASATVFRSGFWHTAAQVLAVARNDGLWAEAVPRQYERALAGGLATAMKKDG